MMNQLRVEFYKLTRFIGVYLLMAFQAGVGVSYGYDILSKSGIGVTSTNMVFQTVIGDTSTMIIIFSVIAWFLGKDFSTRTIQNEIRIGYSRESIFISRSLITFFTIILMHFIWIVFSLLGFILKRGIDVSFLQFTNFIWLITVSLQVMAIASAVIMIEFFAKNASMAIIINIIIVFIGCNIMRNIVDMQIYQITCFGLAQSDSWKVLLPAIICAIVTILAFGLITCVRFRKAEIK